MTFEPDLAIPPGATLRAYLNYIDMTTTQFGEKMGWSFGFAQLLIDGFIPITPEIANKLESMFNISSDTWLNLQRGFDATIKRIVDRQKF